MNMIGILRRTARPTPSRRGYTLIELLIVVALLGLSGSLLIPYMLGRSSLETQAVVRMIIADLHFAQADALAHQDYRRVQFFDDGSGWALIRIASLDEGFDPDTADYLYHATSHGSASDQYLVDLTTDNRFLGISITDVSLDGGQNFMTYDEMGGTISQGGTPGTGGSLLVTSDEATYRVVIAPFTGKITVEPVD